MQSEGKFRSDDRSQGENVWVTAVGARKGPRPSTRRGAVKGWWEVEGGGSAGAEGTRAEPQPSFGRVPREGSLCRHRRPCGKQSGAFQGFARAGGGGRARSPEQVFLPQQVPAFTAQPCPFPRLG